MTLDARGASPDTNPTPGAAPGVTVRAATPEDHPEIARVTVAAYRAADMIPPGTRYDERLADVAARAEAAQLLVAVGAGRIVGAVAYCPYGSAYAEISRPGEAEFRMLAVDPGAQAGGIGAALVSAVLDHARADGAHTVVLSTPDIAHAAHRLYRKLGFVRLPDRDWRPAPNVLLLAYQLPL
ncbi:MAG: GNAT family N-acetyltransferase [Micromonosporaceae bacterium]